MQGGDGGQPPVHPAPFLTPLDLTAPCSNLGRMAKKRTKTENPPTPGPRGVPAPANRRKERRELIQAARGAVAQAVNSGQVVLYCRSGTGCVPRSSGRSGPGTGSGSSWRWRRG